MNKLIVLLVLSASLAYATDNHNPKKCDKPKPLARRPNADANSSSKSSATATGGTVVALGGEASVNNSGNSTNDLANTQSQNAEASNNSNGNNSNNTTYKQVRQTPTAYAPDAFPTAPCTKGVSGGVSTGVFGAAFGGSKTDENCEALETARFFALNGSRLAACKIAITTKSAKKANVSLEDCLGPAPIVVPVAEVVPAPVVPVAVVPETPAVIDPPVVVTPSLLAECDLVSNTISNICKAKLDSAVIFFRNAGEGHLIIEVDAVTGKHRAENIVDYLAISGVERSSIRTQYVPGSNRGARVAFISN